MQQPARQQRLEFRLVHQADKIRIALLVLLAAAVLVGRAPVSAPALAHYALALAA